MKRLWVIFPLAVLLAALVSWAAPETPQERYIRQYASTAVREMYRSGVPASITLAQGLLESRSGQSDLATRGNNHFGIKCHKWTGKTMTHDDDRKGECFRVYDDADASFRDHSDFLRYSDRYKFLFEYKTTDYKSWAYGLKKAGYATDPGYPSKLIKYIEDYHLYDYDKMTVAQADGISGGETAAAPAKEPEQKMTRRQRKAAKEAARASGREERKTRRRAKETTGETVSLSEEAEVSETIPASPLSLEEVKKEEPSETHSFSLSRQMYSKNGVPFIYSAAGETYESIAKANNLFLRELLKYNDLTAPEELLPGTVVFVQPKKAHSAKGLDKYIVAEDGESLRDIAQRFAVKLSSVEKINGFSRNEPLREGDTVKLR